MVYIYYLIDPRDSGIRYVGITKNPKTRMQDHRSCNEKTHRGKWLRSLKRAGFLPTLSIRCIVETWEEACRLEIALIASLKGRGVNLTNGTAGGEGVVDLDPAVRRRITDIVKIANKGNKHLLGYKFSDASRAQKSRSSRGRVHSIETIEKLQRANLKIWTSEKRLQHGERVRHLFALRRDVTALLQELSNPSHVSEIDFFPGL